MENKVLIIFIDSFPYYYLDKTKYMPRFKTKAKVTPGFGYSINCQAELFSGKSPDELGYFCEWTYDPSHSPFKHLKAIFHILHQFNKSYYLDRIMHKILSKSYGDVKNIPFRYLPFMAKTGKNVFSDDFKEDSLFKYRGLCKLFSQNIKQLNNKDYLIYQKSLNVLEENKYNLYAISFTELDHIAHRQGVGSRDYDKKIEQLDKWIWKLRNKFLSNNKDGKVLVISDHGMANVMGGKRLDLEKAFGLPSKTTYYYFLEGTILRVWTFNNNIKEEISNFLNNLNIGTIISSKKRKEFGVSNKKFGDIIFIVNERLMFCSSFWGRKISKAMHGYLPELESQKGIFLYEGNYNINLLLKLKNKDIYKILYNLIISK